MGRGPDGLGQRIQLVDYRNNFGKMDESQEEKESSALSLFCKLLSDSIYQIIGRIIP